MKLSANGLQKLRDWEGQILRAYKDSAGYLTIGVGHLLTAAEKKNGVINIKGKHVIYSPSITEQEALDLLAQDVVPAENAVNENVKVSLTQNQFDALVSFTFNCGDGAFRSSTLLKKLNAGDYAAIPTELKKWNRAGGKVCDGLITRRANEVKLWLA